MAPALAAVLDGVQPAAQAAVDRGVADLGDPLGGQAPARALGLDLERDQHLLDEGAGAGLQLGLLGGQGGRVGDDLGGHGSVGLGLRASAREEAPQGRERLLDAAVRLIAREGIDNVRIARIATEAGVSAGLVHYHFASRDALLEEALEHSYERAGDLRLAALEDGRATAAQRLAAMIDQCLPTDRALHDDFVLWVELWLRSARDPALRPVAARLYARLHAWFAQAMADGVASGELRDCDVDADGRPPAGAHRRLRHPRAHRRSAHAARARARGDLGSGRGRPRPVLGGARSSQQRFALGVGQRPRRAVLAGRRPPSRRR